MRRVGHRKRCEVESRVSGMKREEEEEMERLVRVDLLKLNQCEVIHTSQDFRFIFIRRRICKSHRRKTEDSAGLECVHEDVHT